MNAASAGAVRVQISSTGSVISASMVKRIHPRYDLLVLAAARDWAVLKIGALMLAGAVERHRAAQQDPLMSRAAALFAMLTASSFAGLAQEYDDNDMPRLVGRRRDGRTVGIAGLSEGTRDQLYLALRLAYLEDFALRAEPDIPARGDSIT